MRAQHYSQGTNKAALHLYGYFWAASYDGLMPSLAACHCNNWYVYVMYMYLVNKLSLFLRCSHSCNCKSNGHFLHAMWCDVTFIPRRFRGNRGPHNPHSIDRRRSGIRPLLIRNSTTVTQSKHGPTAANPLLQVYCCWPDGWRYQSNEFDHRSTASAQQQQRAACECGQCHVSAYVGSWTQTCSTRLALLSMIRVYCTLWLLPSHRT